jgi:hypothetical protein
MMRYGNRESKSTDRRAKFPKYAKRSQRSFVFATWRRTKRARAQDVTLSSQGYT